MPLPMPLRRAPALLLAVLLLAVVCSVHVHGATMLSMGGTVSGRTLSASYVAFHGFEEKFVVVNARAATEGAATLVPTCVPGVSVTPSSVCLSHTAPTFTLTVTAAAGSTLAAPVCTWAVYGTQAGEYDVSDLNAAMAGPWQVSPTVQLVHEEPALRVSSHGSPMRVSVGTWFFNVSRADGLALSANGDLVLAMSCSSFAHSSSRSAQYSLLGHEKQGTFQVRFSSLNAGMVMCTFGVVASSSDDEGKFLPPPNAYFSVQEPNPTFITVGAPAGGYRWSSTQHTEQQLSLSVQPVLPAGEWLRLTVGECVGPAASAWLDDQEGFITPGRGVVGTSSSPVVQWGVESSPNLLPAVVLPPFTAGALIADCALYLTGSPRAVFLYQLDPSVHGAFTLHIDTGVRVQLEAHFDQHSELPSDANPIRQVSRPHVYVTLPQSGSVPHVSIHDLQVYIDCRVACAGDTGQGAATHPSPNYSGGGRVRFAVATGLLTHALESSPSWYFSPTQTGADSAPGSVLCRYNLQGAESHWFLPPSDQVFWVHPKRELDITASGGLQSPISSDYFSGVTNQAVQGELFHLRVAAPQQDVSLGLRCTGASVTASGSAFTESRGDYRFVHFFRNTSSAGSFALQVDAHDHGLTVTCQWLLEGVGAGLFNVPNSVDFFVGTPIRLQAVLQTVGGTGLLYDQASDPYGVARVDVSAVSGSEFRVLGDAGISVGVVCDLDTGCVEEACPVVELMRTSMTAAPGIVTTPLQFALDSQVVKMMTGGNGFTTFCRYYMERSGGGALFDYRHFIAPPSSRITFHPRATLTVGGTANGANLPATGASAFLTLMPTQLPAVGEELTIDARCTFPQNDIQDATFTFTPTSPLEPSLFPLTLPTLVEREGITVWCEVSAKGTNKKWVNFGSVVFTVGHLSSFSPVPATGAFPVTYAPTTSDEFRLMPSSCLAGSDAMSTTATLTAKCLPADAGRLKFTDSGTSSVNLNANTQAIGYTIEAFSWLAEPTTLTCSFDLTVFDPAIAFKAPAPLSFPLGLQDSFSVLNAVDLPYSHSSRMMTLGVQPRSPVGHMGQTVTLMCSDGIGGYSASTDLYFFPQSSQAQYTQLQLTPYRAVTHYCRVEPQTNSYSSQPFPSSDELSYGDQRHWVSSGAGSEVAFAVGTMPHFTLSSSEEGVLETDGRAGFMRTTCQQEGRVELTMTPSVLLGSPGVSSNPSAGLSCTNEGSGPQVLIRTTSEPGGAWSSWNSYTTIRFESECNVGEQAERIQLKSNGYTGFTTCSFASSGSGFRVPPPFRLYVAAEPLDDGSSSGLSTAAKIGIGVGVGVGGSALIGGVAYGVHSWMAGRKVVSLTGVGATEMSSA